MKKNSNYTGYNSSQLQDYTSIVSEGIILVGAICIGVIGASGNKGAVFTSGLAAIFAGASVVAISKYLKIRHENHTKTEIINTQRNLIERKPKEQLVALAKYYIQSGASKSTAIQLAKELSTQDPLKVQLKIFHNIYDDKMSKPTKTASISFALFIVGGIAPFLAAVFSPVAFREFVVFGIITILLSVIGIFNAKNSNIPIISSTVQKVACGIITIIFVYAITTLFGTAIS
jgi:integral membrane protein